MIWNYLSFQNFNWYIVDNCKCIGDVIPHLILDVITYACRVAINQCNGWYRASDDQGEIDMEMVTENDHYFPMQLSHWHVNLCVHVVTCTNNSDYQRKCKLLCMQEPWKKAKYLHTLRIFEILIVDYHQGNTKPVDYRKGLSFICSHVYLIETSHQLYIRTPFQYPIKRRMVRYREVSKPQDWLLMLLHHFKIWQTPRHQCCRAACQISERSDNSKYKFRGFEASRDLTIRRPVGYWKALIPMRSFIGHIFYSYIHNFSSLFSG